MKIQVTITIETYMLTHQVTEQMLKEVLDDVIAFNCCDNETAYDTIKENGRLVRSFDNNPWGPYCFFGLLKKLIKFNFQKIKYMKFLNNKNT